MSDRELIAKLDKFYETNAVMTRSEFNNLLLSHKRSKATQFQENKVDMQRNPNLTLITLAAINSAY